MIRRRLKCLLATVFRGVDIMTSTPIERPYEFKGGYPTAETVTRAYDALDLHRAIQANRFFYCTVSSAAIFKGNMKVGVQPNKVFGFMDTQPRHIVYTLNSDTPYGGVLLDLHIGPLVVGLPPGALLGAALDINQRRIAESAFPGPTLERVTTRTRTRSTNGSTRRLPHLRQCSVAAPERARSIG